MTEPSKPQTAELPDIRAQLESQLAERMAEAARHIANGVMIVDPATTYLEPGLHIGPGTTIGPNTTISRGTTIGRDCHIGPNSVLDASQIGDRCVVLASVVRESVLEEDVDIGPFTHLRSGAHLEAGAHLGNYVEVKASRIGRRSKAGHFSYIGDADICDDVNIGAGTVTCNYDGTAKYGTVIEDGAFIGSDTMLVAPVRVGRGASTGAGSVVTKDVPSGERVAGVPARSLDDARMNGPVGDGSRG
jgi:bifunctional UDP-N-acetylglucosamine pyrophosphorylase / glucosamine-1-phosphate N-acetyltransferase